MPSSPVARTTTWMPLPRSAATTEYVGWRETVLHLFAVSVQRSHLVAIDLIEPDHAPIEAVSRAPTAPTPLIIGRRTRFRRLRLAGAVGRQPDRDERDARIDDPVRRLAARLVRVSGKRRSHRREGTEDHTCGHLCGHRRGAAPTLSPVEGRAGGRRRCRHTSYAHPSPRHPLLSPCSPLATLVSGAALAKGAQARLPRRRTSAASSSRPF